MPTGYCIMNLSKREFLQVLAAASVAGMALARYEHADAATRRGGPVRPAAVRQGVGNVSFLHMTDCHAQLKPIHFREPSVNLGIGRMQGQLPHLVGEHLLKMAGVPAGTPRRMRFTFLDFEQRGAPLRQGRRLRPPGHAGQAAEGQPSRRAAARRRRHLAGLGHRAVDQRAGHGRRLPSCWAWT